MIGIRVPDDIKKKLEEHADKQHRPLSNLIRMILLEWIQEQDKPKKK